VGRQLGLQRIGEYLDLGLFALAQLVPERLQLAGEFVLLYVLSYGPAPETQLIHEDENGERVVHTIVRNTQH